MSALSQNSPASTPAQTMERPPIQHGVANHSPPRLDPQARRSRYLFIAGNVALVALEVIGASSSAHTRFTRDAEAASEPSELCRSGRWKRSNRWLANECRFRVVRTWASFCRQAPLAAQIWMTRRRGGDDRWETRSFPGRLPSWPAAHEFTGSGALDDLSGRYNHAAADDCRRCQAARRITEQDLLSVRLRPDRKRDVAT